MSKKAEELNGIALPAELAIKLSGKQELTERAAHGLPVIAYTDLSLIEERILKEGILDVETVKAAVIEYRKFMSLILLTGGGLGMISRAVDEVWHAHILFTRDYFDFCERVFGRYVHHQPVTSAAPSEPSTARKFKSAYRQFFGKLPVVWGHSLECSGTTNCQDHDCIDCRDIPKCHESQVQSGCTDECSGYEACKEGLCECDSKLAPVAIPTTVMVSSCQENSCDSENLCDGAEYPCSSEFGGG